jgi:hypothetical protein
MRLEWNGEYARGRDGIAKAFGVGNGHRTGFHGHEVLAVARRGDGNVDVIRGGTRRHDDVDLRVRRNRHEVIGLEWDGPLLGKPMTVGCMVVRDRNDLGVVPARNDRRDLPPDVPVVKARDSNPSRRSHERFSLRRRSVLSTDADRVPVGRQRILGVTIGVILERAS